MAADMEIDPCTQVCDDAGATVWFYHPGTQKYERRNPFREAHIIQGKVIARLHGRDIPNPDHLWKQRCDVLQVATSSIVGLKLRPSQATYALYHHWQGVQ